MHIIYISTHTSIYIGIYRYLAQVQITVIYKHLSNLESSF